MSATYSHRCKTKAKHRDVSDLFCISSERREVLVHIHDMVGVVMVASGGREVGDTSVYALQFSSSYTLATNGIMLF